ncbi:MAG TPA: AgmX/PglI C-terminal domain-containing protein [Polyangiaceae bacterium]|jgi:hypothetical protein|nr:AgmX/PglI C-terminal domain-containing protein [Polyangiaceae bacterium]
MNKLFIPALLLAAAGASACEYHARSPEDYQTATRAVLDTRSAQIKTCYDGVLKTDKKAAGVVVVHFTVTEETGAITGAEVTKDSTAPEALGQCIVQALEGLTLDPPDERQGDATFVWEFKAAG